MNANIEDIDVKAIVLSDASVGKKEFGQPQNFIRIVGARGMALRTIFSDP